MQYMMRDLSLIILMSVGFGQQFNSANQLKGYIHYSPYAKPKNLGQSPIQKKPQIASQELSLSL